METPRPAIRLGIDFGCTTFRAAYVHPGVEKVVVPVPLPLEHFQPCFPIMEGFKTQDRYISRFFPGLTQRLAPDFPINLRGQSTSSRDIAADLVQRAIREAEGFAGRSIESLMLCAPVTLTGDSRSALERAIALSKLPGELRTDLEAVCAAFRQTELADTEHTTVLILSAGYTGVGVAAVRITPRGARMLARGGDPIVLAGNIFDFQILQTVMRHLQEHRIAVSESANAMIQWTSFRNAVEIAKESIGDEESFQIRLPESMTPEVRGGVTMHLVGTTFRRLVNKHADAAMDIVTSVLDESDIQDSELGHVLLNGGTTHLPDVVRRLKQRFPQAKVHHLPPDAVASGAALMAMESGPSINGQGFMADDIEFIPDPAKMVVPGLVEIVNPPAAPIAAPVAPVEIPPTPEQIEVAAFREKVSNGYFDKCAGELAALTLEVQRRLKTVD